MEKPVGNIMIGPDTWSKPRARVNGPVEDLEFSDYGRDPRYLLAWWILPMLLLDLVVLAAFVE